MSSFSNQQKLGSGEILATIPPLVEKLSITRGGIVANRLWILKIFRLRRAFSGEKHHFWAFQSAYFTIFRSLSSSKSETDSVKFSDDKLINLVGNLIKRCAKKQFSDEKLQSWYRFSLQKRFRSA